MVSVLNNGINQTYYWLEDLDLLLGLKSVSQVYTRVVEVLLLKNNYKP